MNILLRRRGAILVALLLLFCAVTVFLPRDGDERRREVVATFSATTSLYQGAKVKVLGVDVGSVRSIEVVGTAVEVTMDVDDGVDLPVDVRAVIVPPSIVGDRFVQLAPAYSGGPKAPARLTLGLDRTGVPVELDDSYRAIDELAQGLGPNGANKDGAVSELVSALAATLDGRGQLLNDTVRDLSAALGTLAGSSDDVSSTVEDLSSVTSTLAGKDAVIRRLVKSLAAVSSTLNDQRAGMGTAVTTLQTALTDLNGLLREQSPAITRTIMDLADVTRTVAARTDRLENLLKLVPLATVNLGNTVVPTNWDPKRPWLTPVGGRTSSLGGRLTLFLQNLDASAAQVSSLVCAALDLQSQLTALCDAISAVGGSFGRVLSNLLVGRSIIDLPPPPVPTGAGR
ncbi:MAG: MCE family protein [Propionibacteriales bacterium]|nr:MCE family protein [Propionibacteriales bacterium]